MLQLTSVVECDCGFYNTITVTFTTKKNATTQAEVNTIPVVDAQVFIFYDLQTPRRKRTNI